MIQKGIFDITLLLAIQPLIMPPNLTVWTVSCMQNQRPFYL